MKISRSTHDMLGGREGPKRYGRGPLGILRKPLRRQVTRSQNQAPRLLLANDDWRLRKIRGEIREMPKARTFHPSTCRGSFLHHVPVSFHAVVNGYRRSSSQFETETFPPGPHRLFLKMGRGRIFCQHQRYPGLKLRMEKHYLQTQSPL